MGSQRERKGAEAGQAKFGDARDRLPPACPECGAQLDEAELDTSMVPTGTASGTYACEARLIAWSTGPEGPVRVRRCGREAVAPDAPEQWEDRSETELTEEEKRELVEFLRRLREGDERN